VERRLEKAEFRGSDDETSLILGREEAVVGGFEERERRGGFGRVYHTQNDKTIVENLAATESVCGPNLQT
jgi:hypothetical protein